MVVRTAGIVLAAGAGTRFGGPKQVARLGDETVLGRVLRHARAVPALDPLICVLGAHAGLIRAQIDFTGIDVVVADDWAAGQASSLKAGVVAAGDVEAALILLGDQPGIPPEVIEKTLHHQPDKHDGVRATYGGVPGHPVLLGGRLLDRVPGLTGDTGARALLSGNRTIWHWEAGALADPTDIDTPETLEAFTP